MRTPLRQRIAAIAQAVAPTVKKTVPRTKSITSPRRVSRAASAVCHAIHRKAPDKDGLGDVQEKDAPDRIEFTREYLHHVYVVYVLPRKLNDRRPPSTLEMKQQEFSILPLIQLYPARISL